MEKLEWAARALAQPHDVQVSLFPYFVEVADELGLNWDEAFRKYIDNPDALSIFTPQQKEALLELDRYMESISGKKHLHLWMMEALVNTEEWAIMRRLASEVLAAMNWSLQPPPKSVELYVLLPPTN